jgi:tetratricopeptide (TPR) repeat protein
MQGNVHFREGRYEDAVTCYERAIMTYGPRVVYMSNLAAAYLKLEEYVSYSSALATLY